MPIILGNNEISGVSSILDSGGTTAVNISASGSVSYPQRPYTTGNLYGPSGGGDAVTYNGEDSRGISFNSSNGRFTVPVDGLYHISWTGICGTSSSDSGRRDLRIQVNGSTVAQTLSPDNGNGYKHRLATYCYYLTTSDYVTINAQSFYQAGTSGWARFSMVLIG